MKKLKVGLIGYGSGGRIFHEPLINSVEGFELQRIFNRSGKDNDQLIEKYGRHIIADKADDILSDPEIDLAVIALPNFMHFEIAKKALKKGKHVLVEKPFTVTSYEADQLIALSKKAGKIITVNHNRRYDSDFRTVKKILDAGFLGNTVEYEAHFDRFRSEVRQGSWKEDTVPGSGILYDLGSHLIDQAKALFGMPEEIFACLDIQREGARTTDSCDILLRYSNFTARLKAGMLVREQGPKYTIHGTRGSFIKYGMDVQEHCLKQSELPVDRPDWGKEPESIWGRLNTDIEGVHFCGNIESEHGDYQMVYKNLHDAICGSGMLHITPEQARDTIRLIELAQKSSEMKCWISVN